MSASLRLPAHRVAAFWARVHVDEWSPSGCWEWTGCATQWGYGRLQIEGREVAAHRVAYWLDTGRDPGELLVRHRCDNPPCCRPDHLELGTAAENLGDAIERRRWRAERCRSRLTAEQVEEMRWRRHAHGERSQSLVRRFGVTRAMVRRITNGIAFPDLPGPTSPLSEPHPPRPRTVAVDPLRRRAS